MGNWISKSSGSLLSLGFYEILEEENRERQKEKDQEGERGRK